QQSVEDIYGTFIQHVAEGRKMLASDVDSIGQGRVWSGTDAKRLGLVDDLGGINKAIDEARQLAKLDKYRVIELPQEKKFIDKLFEDLNDQAATQRMKAELGTLYDQYQGLKSALQWQGVQARLPYVIDIR
ncbi:MAG: S49 family peptidase, partial [Bacteroidia bacterium]